MTATRLELGTSIISQTIWLGCQGNLTCSRTGLWTRAFSWTRLWTQACVCIERVAVRARLVLPCHRCLQACRPVSAEARFRFHSDTAAICSKKRNFQTDLSPSASVFPSQNCFSIPPYMYICHERYTIYPSTASEIHWHTYKQRGDSWTKKSVTFLTYY